MTGRVLIIDDVATNRIVLKVKLASAAYDVWQAESPDQADALIATQPPDLVLVSDRIGGAGGAGGICRRLRRDPATAWAGILVTSHSPGGAARRDLIAAGADEVLGLPVDESALLAHVRSLMRRRPPPGPVPATGMAEPAAPFEAPGLIAVVAQDETCRVRLARDLTGRMRDRVAPLAPAAVLDRLRSGPVPDAFVIAAGRSPDRDLRLIAELRSRPTTEVAPVVVIGAPGPDFRIMALDLGASDVIPPDADVDEVVLRLRRRLRQKRETDRRRAAVERELKAAVTDPLTGLANRRAAFSRLGQIAAAATRSGREFALMILDIDRFKDVNDRHGHLGGDRVLTAVATRLAANLREHDLVARIGGEEFLVVLPDTGMAPARAAAERLRRVIEAEPVVLAGGESVFVTLSIGLCLGAGAGEDVEAALDRADRALYDAKARGRNMVTVGRSVA